MDLLNLVNWFTKFSNFLAPLWCMFFHVFFWMFHALVLACFVQKTVLTFLFLNQNISRAYVFLWSLVLILYMWLSYLWPFSFFFGFFTCDLSILVFFYIVFFWFQDIFSTCGWLLFLMFRKKSAPHSQSKTRTSLLWFLVLLAFVFSEHIVEF